MIRKLHHFTQKISEIIHFLERKNSKKMFNVAQLLALGC